MYDPFKTFKLRVSIVDALSFDIVKTILFKLF